MTTWTQRPSGSTGWSNTPDSLIVAPSAPIGAISVKDCGAVGDGVANDTVAIQAALNLAAANGGTVYLPVGTYLVTTTLTLGENSMGVRMIGAGDGYYDGGAITGTAIKWTGTGACIDVPACYGFEIARFGIYGAQTGENGIRLCAVGSTPPRTASIHDMSIRSCTGSALKIEAASYMKFSNLMLSYSAKGLELSTGATLLEFVYFDRLICGGNSGYGIYMNAGAECFFTQCNLTGNTLGDLKITRDGDSHGLWGLYFYGLKCDSSPATNIEIDATGAYITDILFRDTRVFLNGDAATETALKCTDTSGNKKVVRVYIEGINVQKRNATAPTKSVDLAGCAATCKLTGYDDLAVGGNDFGIVTVGSASAEWNVPTLLNSWEQYNDTPGFQAARYMKDADGWIHLKGYVSGGTPGGESIAFTLPASYRPAQYESFAVSCSGGLGVVDVSPNGNVTVISGSTVWTSLSVPPFRTQ